MGRANEFDSPPLTLIAHVHEPVPAPRSLRPDLPDDLEAIVLRLLAKTPHARFAAARELDEALARCALASNWTEGRR